MIAATPPKPAMHPVSYTLHDDVRSDPYTWLREKQNPAVLAYLEAENAYTAHVMEPTRDLQTDLYADLVGRIQETDMSVPYRRGAYNYYSRTQAGQQYPTFCRRALESEAAETILLDLNELGAGQAFVAVGDFIASDDGTLLAYSLDTTGYRQYRLYVKDLTTGNFVGEPIERVDSVVWAPDNTTLLYCTQDAVTKRSDTIWRHSLASGARSVVFAEADELFDAGIMRTREGKHFIITSVAKDTTECRYLASDEPQATPLLFAPRRDGVRYEIGVRDEQFYILTNEGSPDFEIFVTPVATPDRSAWTRIVAARPAITITGIELFADFAAVTGRRDGLPSIELLDVTSRALTPLKFDEADYVVELGDNAENETPALRIAYESMVTPRSIFDIEVASGRRTLLKRTEVPGYDPARYTVERRFEPARDGTAIPISIVRAAAAPRDGTAPLLLYGYGSYGICIDAGFSAARLALLDRGVTYAIAHIRGGGEYGEAWRVAGNLQHKRTTFTDFIDCAEGLIAAGYTSADRLAITGASAGGLLVGAVVNERPELCAAAIAKVPFVDVLTTMLDATLPLTTGEYREWGNPADAASYRYMRSYSPLDNVRAQAYPAMLVDVSLNDSQVPYWEGAKFAAKLRDLGTGDRPILLRTNMHAGHGGASGRYDKLRDLAFEYAFVLTNVGA